MDNYMHATFPAISSNESLSRMLISAFVSQVNPTLDELSDVKTAVSEAVTNCIIHGYGQSGGEVELFGQLEGNTLTVEVTDRGVGIENIDQAREPFYTSKPDMERSGMGFTVMETFMEQVEVISRQGEGTTVRMKKTLSGAIPEADRVEDGIGE